MKRIIIFAANSFLGRELVAYFSQYNYEIIVVTRKTNEKFKQVLAHEIWDGKSIGPWASWLNSVDGIINLAGKSVNCRYTKKNKAAILASRLASTSIIQHALDLSQTQKSVCWLNASSATIYAHEEKNANTEIKGEIGKGFSVEVCKQWENEFFKTQIDCIRKIALRTSIVLGKSGGVLPVLVKLAKRGLGGKMGQGTQRFSWIGIEDFCRATRFLMENSSCKGVYNIVSPNSVTNQTFQLVIRNAYSIRYFINQPKWLLELGAVFLGTETELVLKSRYVYPERLLNAGFQFKTSEISELIKLELVNF